MSRQYPPKRLLRNALTMKQKRAAFASQAPLDSPAEMPHKTKRAPIKDDDAPIEIDGIHGSDGT